jgi:hypothetical protein
MLYHTFCKIQSEILQDGNIKVTTDGPNMTVNSSLKIGSILEFELEIRFFRTEEHT